MGLIAWVVSQNILVAQLLTDFRCDVRQIVWVACREGPSTCEFRDFSEQLRSVELLDRLSAVAYRIKNTDGVQLGVCLSNQTLDVALGIPTMIVATVGDDKQSASSVMCVFHLSESQIDRIEQSGGAFRRHSEHASLNFFDIVREPTEELDAIVETDDKELVLWISSPEELKRSLLCSAELVGHTSAQIKNDADGCGNIF